MKKVIQLILILLFLNACVGRKDINPEGEVNCDVASQVTTEDVFNEISTDNYIITNVVLNEDCLDVTISSSGCNPDFWEMNLYSTNAFYAIFPIQRAVKVELINNEECLAVFGKTVSFDLTSFRIENQNEVPLNIIGWNEQLIYIY